jgi:LysM repeat protein
MYKIVAGCVSIASMSLILVGTASAATKSPVHDGAKFVSVANLAAVATPAPVAPKIYTVVAGDNLSDIAASQGLVSWRPLWNANASIGDPNMIYPDQQLTVPNGPTTDRPVPAEQAATAAALDQSSSVTARVIQQAAPTHATNYAAGSEGIFARIRQRESGGNYATNTGNGYYGAYQYDLGTWANYDGYARPDLAPPAVQDAKAASTYAARGCSPWPNTCY